MAARDVEFYKYLIEAFRYKINYPRAASFQLGKYFFDYTYIFQQARRVFPRNYNNLAGKDIKNLTAEQLNELDTQYIKEILGHLDGIGGFSKDIELEKYLRVETASSEPEVFYKELEENNLNKEPSETKPESINESSQTQTQTQTRTPTPSEPPPKKEAPKEEKEAPPSKPNVKAEPHSQTAKGKLQSLFSKPEKSPPGDTNKPIRLGPGRIPLQQAVRQKPASSGLTALFAQGPRIALGARILKGKIPQPVSKAVLDLSTAAAIGSKKAIEATPPFVASFFKSTAGQALETFTGGAENLGRRGRGISFQSPGSFFSSLGGGGNRGGRVGGGGRGSQNMGSALDPRKNTGKKVLISFLLFFLFLMMFQYQASQQQTPTEPGGVQKLVDIKKSGPDIAGNGERINYQISVTNLASSSANITVTDQIQGNVKYIESEPKGEISGADDQGNGGSLVWKLDGVEAKGLKTISLIVEPQEENIWVVNQAKATSTATTGGGGIIGVGSANLGDIFNLAAKNANIPSALLVAIGKTESRVMEYDDVEVAKFSTPSWWVGKVDNAPSLKGNDPDILRGYGYDTCSYPKGLCAPGADVRGVLQFELQTFNGIKSQMSFSDGHEPDRRNLMDNIFGSGLLNRKNAESYTGSKDVVWNEDAVRAVARMYCAGPAAGKDPSRILSKACGWHKQGDLTYDDRVWRDYNAYMNGN